MSKHVVRTKKNQDTYTITIPKRKRIPESMKTTEYYHDKAGIRITKALKSLKRLKNLADPKYGMTEKEKDRVLKAIGNRLQMIRECYTNPHTNGATKTYKANKPVSFFDKQS